MPTVLVTGAGRGIGLAITERMSEAGWTVYATARSSSALARLDGMQNVHGIELDITDRSAIAKLPELLPSTLDGVVNNAGIIVSGPVEGLSIDDLARQLDVNVVSQIAAPPKRVTTAVHHALTASRPKRRYVLDTASRIQKVGVALTPALVTDALLAAVTT